MKHRILLLDLVTGKKSPVECHIFDDYESGEKTITSDDDLVLAHGFTRRPRLIMYELICKVADQGFSVGEILDAVGCNKEIGASSYGMTPRIDATNITIAFADNANVFRVLHKTTRTEVDLTNSSWKIMVTAYV